MMDQLKTYVCNFHKLGKKLASDIKCVQRTTEPGFIVQLMEKPYHRCQLYPISEEENKMTKYDGSIKNTRSLNK